MIASPVRHRSGRASVIDALAAVLRWRWNALDRIDPDARRFGDVPRMVIAGGMIVALGMVWIGPVVGRPLFSHDWAYASGRLGDWPGDLNALTLAATMANLVATGTALVRPRLAMLIAVATVMVPTLWMLATTGLLIVVSSEQLLVIVLIGLWPHWWSSVVLTASPPVTPLTDATSRPWLGPTIATSTVLLIAAELTRGGEDWAWREGTVSFDVWLAPVCLLPVLGLLRPRMAMVVLVASTAYFLTVETATQQWDRLARHQSPWWLLASAVATALLLLSARRWVSMVAGLVTATLLALMGVGYVRLRLLSAQIGGSSQALVLSVAGLVLLGLTLLAHRYRAASLRVASQAAALDSRQTELRERARLARDLHDVVAHHVSLIAVRAETAPYTHSDLSDSSKQVLAEIADDARRTLDELRGVLGVLRRTDLEGHTTSPLPGATELVDLVERNRASGMSIQLSDLRGAYALYEQTTGRGHVLYRVLQESLTNARRHAPGTPVLVVLADRAPQLVVTNPLPAAPVTNPGSQQGLVGMRERVEAMGGVLEVDASDDFRVEVSWND